jgi:hypothetical protein
MTGLPPGEYYVAAVDYLETGEEFDPLLLQQLVPVATRVMLKPFEPLRLTLSLFERPL